LTPPHKCKTLAYQIKAQLAAGSFTGLLMKGGGFANKTKKTDSGEMKAERHGTYTHIEKCM
jgi:hypothetical protein